MLRRKKTNVLDEPIDKVLEEMRTYSTDAPEYKTALEQLERLTKLRNESSRRVTPDMMLLVAGNLAGILVIVAYEQKHVLASKAQNFILRTR